MCDDIPCDSSNSSVADIFWIFLYSWYMVYSIVALISIVVLKIPMTAYMWHAAPMGEFKEELIHHMEYCEIFSHHIILIGAFTAWVRGPSILYTFIPKRCHAFIISVIVVIRRSTICIEHYMWPLIIVNHRTNFHLCPTGSKRVMSKCAHFHIWAMRLTWW